MAIHILSTWVSNTVPTSYYIPAATAFCLFFTLKTLANGRKNLRDRDMHGRVILITGGFTPIGLTLIHELAQRGAQIIALTPSLADPTVEELISAIRTVTSNDLIFAEECDLTSPASIRSFSKKFLSTSASGPTSNVPGEARDPPRLDAVVFAHEYTHVGAFQLLSKVNPMEENIRLEGGLATFLLMTSLLPCLIKAPGDRDIRVVSVVNPLYAASVPTYVPPLSPAPDDTPEKDAQQDDSSPANTGPEPPKPTTTFQAQISRLAMASTSSLEGHRALRSILLMRHLQRVLDVLASQSHKPVPSTDKSGATTVKKQATSNITAVSVSPGFSCNQTIAPYLRASKESEGYWVVGFWIYFLLYPLITMFAKNSTGAAQTILYALFAPTPRSRIDDDPEPTASEPSPDGQSPKDPTKPVEPVPRLQGGLLYRECRPTQLPGRGVALMDVEGIGRAVWEEMERGVEVWERSEGEVLKELAKEVEEEAAKGKGKEKENPKDN